MPKHGENIWKRKDGRWEARVIAERDSSGKASYYSVYAKSYKEVKAKRDDALLNFRNVTKKVFTQSSVASAINEYLCKHQFSVKNSTYALYVGIAERYLYPRLGSVLLSKVTQETITNFIISLQTEGKSSGGGLSPKTIKDIVQLLKLVFKYSEEMKYLSIGKLDFSMPKQTKPQIKVLSLEQQRILEAYVKTSDDLYKFGVYLCLNTGLRIGEICALKWSDIDCENATIKVNHTVLRIKNVNTDSPSKTQLVVNSPKTASSERLIPLPKGLNKMIIDIKESIQPLGGTYFLTCQSKFLEPRNYYVHYKKYIEKCNLDDFNFHALRHTFATRCIEAGVDSKALSEILGHASVKITLDRYVHPSIDSKRNCMEKVFAS